MIIVNAPSFVCVSIVCLSRSLSVFLRPLSHLYVFCCWLSLHSAVFSVCCQNLPDFSGGPVIGAAVAALREKLSPSDTVSLAVASQQVDFGATNLNLTLQRLDNCTHVRTDTVLLLLLRLLLLPCVFLIWVCGLLLCVCVSVRCVCIDVLVCVCVGWTA